MLSKLATQDITEEEFGSLVDHLRSSTETQNVNAMLSLYNKLPVELQFSGGEVYRGLRIDNLPDTKKLFENNMFVAKNRKKSTPIESWTQERGQGIRFAKRALWVGIVLQRTIRGKDVGIFNQQVQEYLEKNMPKMAADVVFGETYTDWNMLAMYWNEREVMLRHRPNKQYNLCRDVVLVTVRADILTGAGERLFVGDDGQLQEESNSDYAELPKLLSQHLDDYSREKIEKYVSDYNQGNVVEHYAVLFECNGFGELMFSDWIS